MKEKEKEKEKEKWIPFSKREEWNDIDPVPQDDGPFGGVCCIAYTDRFRETMDYFRAIIKKEEKSERALQLVGEVITANAANYTAWYYRRKILEELKSDVKKELEWTTNIALANPKNYQIWYHRRVLIERTKDATAELQFTKQMILADNKNYHAWAHRQWAMIAFDLWEGELEFVSELLKIDLRNNSAWNQRHFVLLHRRQQVERKEKKEEELEKIDEEEAQFAWSFIGKSPNNQCGWNFLKGLYKGKKYKDIKGLKEKCLEFKERIPTCPHVVSLLIDIYKEENTTESLQTAIQFCDLLANSLAQIQSKYLNHKKSQLEEKQKASKN